MEAGREGRPLSLWGVKSTVLAPSSISAIGAACPAPPPPECLLFASGHTLGAAGLPQTAGTSLPPPSGSWATWAESEVWGRYCSVLWGAGLRAQVVDVAELCQDPGPRGFYKGPWGMGRVLHTPGFLGLAWQHRLEKVALRPKLPS